MKAKLVVEGKEFDIEILDKELAELVSPKKKTGYERSNIGGTYYTEGRQFQTTEDGMKVADERYKKACYYSDKTIAENNFRADTLMRQLRRFAVEHRGQSIKWDSKDVVMVYTIDYNTALKYLEVRTLYAGSPTYGTLYFKTKEAAIKAIETFHDELVWYFTEYKDSL